MNIAADSDYCPECKVLIMDEACFCEWNENAPKENAKDLEFIQKIRSINFSRVK